MNSESGELPALYHLPGFHEPFSAMSHLAGAVLFLVLGYLLLRRGWGDRTRVLLLGIYAISCVVLLSLSSVYHMVVRGGTAHQVMERLDHGAIFLLIAGTFTPVHGLLFRGWLCWGPLLVIWIAAITGITLKTIFFDGLSEWLGLTFYLTLGWCGLLSVVLLGKRYGFTFVKPLLLGGVAYSIGGAMDFLRWPVLIPRVLQPHEVFHLAILVGAYAQWLFIWQFAGGDLPAA
jgi:channel protein (hemolysin III family)